MIGIGRKVLHVSKVGGEDAAGGGEEDDCWGMDRGGDEVVGFHVGLGTDAGVLALGALATALFWGGLRLTLFTLPDTTEPERYRAVSDEREDVTLPASSSASVDRRAKPADRMLDELGWREIVLLPLPPSSSVVSTDIRAMAASKPALSRLLVLVRRVTFRRTIFAATRE